MLIQVSDTCINTCLTPKIVSLEYMPVSISIYGSATIILLVIVLIRQAWLNYSQKNSS